jgi:hypothetical protein
VLESDNQSPTTSVEIRNPFNPATFATEKYTILDVKATDERGGIFVIEFQTSERITFANRMTYYGCRAFGGQLFHGGDYSKLKAVIAIAVTTFEMFRQLESIHNSFRLTAKADCGNSNVKLNRSSSSKEILEKIIFKFGLCVYFGSCSEMRPAGVVGFASRTGCGTIKNEGESLACGCSPKGSQRHNSLFFKCARQKCRRQQNT